MEIGSRVKAVEDVSDLVRMVVIKFSLGSGMRARFVPLSNNDDFAVFYDFHLIFGEEGDIVIVTELANGNDESGG